jgi:hypothetical protein
MLRLVTNREAQRLALRSDGRNVVVPTLSLSRYFSLRQTKSKREHSIAANTTAQKAHASEVKLPKEALGGFPEGYA